ncbi:unnamed protein product, partial [Prorocentrum cordatum]
EQSTGVEPRATCASTAKGCFATANGDNFGPLKAYLQLLDEGCMAVAAQEHHVAESEVPRAERDLRDLGFHGVIAPAVPTGQGGTSGGVAILVPAHIAVAAGPTPPDGWCEGKRGVLSAGRLAAAHVYWGPPGGVVITSAYFVTSVGMTPQNQHLLQVLASYVGHVIAKGLDWMAMGDWNMAPEVLEQRWLGPARGFLAAPSVHTSAKCLPGSALDNAACSRNLLPRMLPPQVDEASPLPVHAAVKFPILADDRALWMRVPREPAGYHIKPGCARPPLMDHWQQADNMILAACDDGDLQYCWDEVLRGLEAELLNRADVMDVHAWASLARWAKHVLRSRAHLTRLVRLCAKDPGPRVFGTAKNFAELCWFFERIAKAHHVWAHATTQVRELFAKGIMLLVELDLEVLMSQIATVQDRLELMSSFGQDESMRGPYVRADLAMDEWES